MRLTVRRIELDRDGYTRRGVYFGTGERLYTCSEISELRAVVSVWCGAYGGTADTIRAPNLAAARAKFQDFAEWLANSPARAERGES